MLGRLPRHRCPSRGLVYHPTAKHIFLPTKLPISVPRQDHLVITQLSPACLLSSLHLLPRHARLRVRCANADQFNKQEKSQLLQFFAMAVFHWHLPRGFRTPIAIYYYILLYNPPPPIGSQSLPRLWVPLHITTGCCHPRPASQAPSPSPSPATGLGLRSKITLWATAARSPSQIYDQGRAGSRRGRSENSRRGSGKRW